ncbi:hypothetical protein [Kitasatospora cathayae]|uniref:Uncharacterized protein n=1 Tax=Kitasatospora cathayae TaxID=3004092 RepID=A0ABY7Q2V7_9ACTN|nr:hypothetical protein [Kitasatospora sp. HUAS 3-15]WBP87016.1 hypothetical protein O1G21_14980 [Kitasatospora sp. HUAS 3-15]
MNDHRETILTLSGERIVIRTERTTRMTVAKLESDHTKAVKATVSAWRASVGKPKAFPNHTRGNLGLIEKIGDAPVRYTSVNPDVLADSLPGVTHETIDPNTSAPLVEPVVEPVTESMSSDDFLASLFARFAA